MRILVVEDDPHLGSVLKASLEAECFSVDWAVTGTQGSYMARTNEYDVVLLDYMLPERDGREVCQDIRSSGRSCAILLLTVRSEVDQKVDLLNCGADDYLTKPYAFSELLARMRALLRRSQVNRPDILSYRDLRLDRQGQTLVLGDKEIYLTRKEFMLLEYLLLNQGKVVSRAMLSEHVWDKTLDTFSNTIESHILNLRRKIDRPGIPSLISTIPGRGYKVG